MSDQLLTPQSVRVKHARQLTRRASRVERREFLAEGPQAVREALRVPGLVRDLFATASALQRYPELDALLGAGDVQPRLCDDQAVASLSGSVTPQGVVAVCAAVDIALDTAVCARSSLVVVGANIRDPGNAGSLLRVADAVGADAVVFAGSSVDVYNDKAVRASAGSLFHLPVVVGPTVEAAVLTLKEQGLVVLAADGGGGESLDDLLVAGDLSRRTAWVFGNEAWGITPGDATLCDRVVAVPIYGLAESLNVATAAAVCLYATARAQRAVSS